MLQEFQKATLKARAATGEKLLGTVVKNGKSAVVNHFAHNGRYEPVYLTGFIDHAETVAVMNEIAETGILPA